MWLSAIAGMVRLDLCFGFEGAGSKITGGPAFIGGEIQRLQHG